jgi:hypothetical protein
MNVGDSVEVEGKTITLKNVGSGGAVIVDVDGVTKQISASGTEQVGDIEIYNQEFFYTNELSERAATLVVGEEATKTYTDGDAYIGEDEDDPKWVWDIAGTTGGSPTLGIKNGAALIFDDPDDNPPSIGDSLAFPNDFVQLTVESYTVSKYKDYTFDATGGQDELYFTNGTTEKRSGLVRDLIHLHADGDGDDGFTVLGNETDDVYLYDTAVLSEGIEVYWYDTDVNHPVFAGNGTSVINGITLEYDDTTYTIAGAAYTQNTTVQFDVEEASGQNFTVSFASTGGRTSDSYYLEESTDRSYLNYTNDNIARDISSWEKDTRTEAGTIIYNPDASDYEVKIGVPSDSSADFKVNIAFSTESSTIVSGGGGGAVTMPVGVSKTDT